MEKHSNEEYQNLLNDLYDHTKETPGSVIDDVKGLQTLVRHKRFDVQQMVATLESMDFCLDMWVRELELLKERLDKA